MNSTALMIMIVALSAIWGGLILSAIHLVKILTLIWIKCQTISN